MRKLLATGFLLAVAAAPAAAQDYKPVDVYFGFGWAFPTTDLKNSFDAGWNGTIGAMGNASPSMNTSMSSGSAACAIRSPSNVSLRSCSCIADPFMLHRVVVVRHLTHAGVG